MMIIDMRYIWILLSAIYILSSCTALEDEFRFPATNTGDRSERVPVKRDTSERRKVFVAYLCGNNSLSSYIKDDIEDLLGGYVPGSGRSSDVFLIYSHLTKSDPVLFRAYSDIQGQVCRDTILKMPSGTVSSSASTLNEVMTFIKDTYRARSYGLLFSSHATGWLPPGYYSSPGSYDAGAGVFQLNCSMAVPYIEPERDENWPAVKSIGQDVMNGMSYEMTVMEFADALPMKFDYILFDACLMGGIEIAYELKDKCGRIGFSQTEVLADGFDYSKLASDLLEKTEPDVESVCRNYFEHYNAQSGAYRSATISMVDCGKLDDLAKICSEIFEKYRTEIGNVPAYSVQRYFTGNHHWFYDLKDIIAKAGANETDIAGLDKALEECIVYKAATPEFLGVEIENYSGLSMYLPCNGSRYLDTYYADLQWNLHTSLVK